MPAWSYYSKERKEFKEAYDRKLTIEEAKIIHKKLCGHFKLGRVQLSFTSGNRFSRGGTWTTKLNVNQLTFGILCHELGHTMDVMKNRHNGRWHTKKHRTQMKRLVNYCRRKKWWEDELKRRASPKQPKQKPTTSQIRETKIEKRKGTIKKFERKIKYYTTMLKKTKRSLNALERRNNLEGI